jgi:hypothetical protein
MLLLVKFFLSYPELFTQFPEVPTRLPLRHHGPIESLIEIRRRRAVEIHRGIGANEIRKRRPVDQIAGSGQDATFTRVRL